MPKPPKSTIRYSKIVVLRVLEKYRKTIENMSQNGPQKYPKWSPWRPWGDQGATVSPPGVDFEGPENGSIFGWVDGRPKGAKDALQGRRRELNVAVVVVVTTFKIVVTTFNIVDSCDHF